MKIVVSVTKKDIDNGIRGDAEECMVSLALRRRLKIDTCEVLSEVVPKNTMEYGRMDCNLVMSDKKGMEFYGIVPSKVIRLIWRYDNQKKIKPFRFFMEAPPKIVRRARREGPSPAEMTKVLQAIERDLEKDPARVLVR